jgi:tetratricopeptide (TPR) repeat protein
VPPLKDVLEITFMGPGLVCIAVVLFGGGASLLRRWRTHRAAAIDRLTDEATELFFTGRLEEARVKAEAAVALAHRKRPRATARAHFCLGRVLGRSGDLPRAEVHLAQAAALNADPHLTALALANLSLVLTRLGRVGEALDRAGEAVRIHRGIEKYPEPFMRVGAGWANVAMSLALTDSGQDGEAAADGALAIFEEAEVASGLAHAYYAKAYALYGRDDGKAFGPANEAFHRFRILHGSIPSLYREQLAVSRKLLESIAEAA